MSIDPTLTTEAAEALRWTLTLSLTPAEWAYVDAIMAALDEAVAAGDEEALREAVLELDGMSTRVERRLGQEPDEPGEPEVTNIPARSRDRANDLVHRLAPEVPRGDPPAQRERT